MGDSYDDDWDEDGEYPSFFVQTMVTARKQHTCCECREIIPPKTQYCRSTGCWDGRVTRFKQCAQCVAILNRLSESITMGGLWLRIDHMSADNPLRQEFYKTKQIKNGISTTD